MGYGIGMGFANPNYFFYAPSKSQSIATWSQKVATLSIEPPMVAFSKWTVFVALLFKTRLVQRAACL